jgi:hypothetical protein
MDSYNPMLGYIYYEKVNAIPKHEFLALCNILQTKTSTNSNKMRQQIITHMRQHSLYAQKIALYTIYVFKTPIKRY